MRLNSISLLLLAAALAGCGGDDTGTAPPTNLPPSFGTTRLDINYPENGTGPVTTLTISDESLTNLSLAVSGADGALFAIVGNRSVVFNSPPDFENPRDVGADNVYNFTVTATDTIGNSTTLQINVTVTNDATAGLRYVDPVFAATASLGSVPLADGNAVSLIGPAGDTLNNRPLLLVAPGGDAAASLAMAEGFAQRGYVAGLISGPADSFGLSAQALGGAASLFASPGFDARGLGIDGGAIFVAGEGIGAQAASLLGVGGTVRGALALGGGLFDPGRASATSAVLFAAGEARQGSAFAQAYRASGVPMQHLAIGTGGPNAGDRAIAIAGAAQLFHAEVLGRSN